MTKMYVLNSKINNRVYINGLTSNFLKTTQLIWTAYTFALASIEDIN